MADIYELREKLEPIRVAKYRFVLRPFDFIKLTSYAGSSLRKDFSPVFKQITCTEIDGKCKACKKKKDCPYYISLEVGQGIPDPEYKRYQTPPKPFIFEPPLQRKTFYSKNEDLYYDLILVGKTLEYFPFFAASLQRLGQIGIGRNQGKYSMKRILAIDLLQNVVAGEYNFNSGEQVGDRDFSVSLGQIYEKYSLEYDEVNLVNVTLATPLRMKRIGAEKWHLYFRTLMRNILTRIANLAYAYSGYTDFLHFPEIIYDAGSVHTVKENFTWEDWRSRAVRESNSKVRLGGCLGDVSYRGEITAFWPILRLGEILHIGKNTSFGLGRILLEKREPDFKYHKIRL